MDNELKAKLLAAKSAEEVTELLKADGQEITPEDAAHLREEIERKRNADGKELSLDELDAITGGRDWPTQGCAATEKMRRLQLLSPIRKGNLREERNLCLQTMRSMVCKRLRNGHRQCDYRAQDWLKKYN